MRGRATMHRDEAAALLGVRADASLDDVRHAWRMWARIAHPDRGGDAAHFARLDEARRVLSMPAAPWVTPPAPSTPSEPAPRQPLRSVLRPPQRPAVLAVTALITVLAACLPAVLGAHDMTTLVATALPGAVCAAAWAAIASRQVLLPQADPGHLMATLVLLWLPIAALQQVASAAAGASLLGILPVLAAPLVAAVAAVNPGAGLWRPIHAPRRD